VKALNRSGFFAPARRPTAKFKSRPDRRGAASSPAKPGFQSMLFEWLQARQARKGGSALADRIARQAAPGTAANAQELFRRVECEVRIERLSFLKRAMFANAFKWRLIENGVASELVDELTQRLLLHHSLHKSDSAADADSAASMANRPPSGSPRHLLNCGDRCIATGAYAEAVTYYQEFLKVIPRHAEALNNLGAAHCKQGQYQEAEECFREAISINPKGAEAHSNLGNLLGARGLIAESEAWFRSAVKLKPNYVDARNSLAATLAFRGRLLDAKAQYRKIFKIAPDNASALSGMAHVAAIEGRFDEAERLYRRALKVCPKMPSAWAGLARIRKMTSSDSAWLEGAEQIVASGISPMDEAEMRFSMGKYCDDVRDFAKAFQNYRRANELSKTLARDYDGEARSNFVDNMIRTYSTEAISQIGGGGSSSAKPVFVVGMPRSGTSLAEQIIASHPAAKGAGELSFWSDAADKHQASTQQGGLAEPIRKVLAEEYLRELVAGPGDAPRIVDKAPGNGDYLGLIHSVFPNARIIYMRRDPIDTCLSCYFQQFAATLNFTNDLSDLAHFSREHQRLMAHWRAVLPPGSIIEVPYEALIADQESWTRNILEFIGLEWEDGCLDFHKTARPVVTSSYWQVRQKVYEHSVARWRNYEKFIGPLRGLKN
jgi:tetratricopeptide (TPR) repeat protein